MHIIGCTIFVLVVTVYVLRVRLNKIIIIIIISLNTYTAPSGKFEVLEVLEGTIYAVK